MSSLPTGTDSPSERAQATAEAVAPPTRIGRRSSTRRDFLFGGAAVAAASAGALAIITDKTPRNPGGDPGVPGFQPVAPPTENIEAWGTPELRLARRITMGLTSAEAALARAKGFSGYLEYHLNPDAIDDSAVNAFVAANYPQIAQQGTELYTLSTDVVLRQLQEATLFRAAFSKKQLFERMVEFWTDHFNISMREVGYLKTLDDREVIRRHALGNFPDMLRASAHSAAMLVYLDNNTSRYPKVNENYARELMELHTMGVDGGYTQTDVAEVARCLSGWTIKGRGEFNFDPTGHDFGAKSFLGQTIPAAPGTGAAAVSEGDKVLNVLAAHPSTAKYIATKMSRWLLTYEPSPALVASVASVYQSTGGNIPAMIRTILTPANLAAAPAKHKRPFHFVVSALRALNPRVTNVTGIATTRMSLVGQQSFVWETPDGYPDKVQFWSGLIMQRWAFGDYLTALTTGEVTVDVAPFMRVNRVDAVVASINIELFGGEMPQRTFGELTTYLEAGTLNAARVRETLAL
ncbi:MAG TPA: DUF1800 domain-containing protein, partial [Gemmatimonadaceae bacterium]|nr:DUF1800 domain-containing protein [Gemmatimonadaceae bacterium]